MKTVFRHKNDPLKRIIDEGGSVLVVGLGKSGISAANLLARAGCRVEISERARPSGSAVDLSLLEPAVQVHWGGHPWDLFEKKDLVVVSPGVPHDLEQLVMSRVAGIPVMGEMELAYRLTAVPWTAVTGSNGKSTTVSLLDLMAREGGLRVATGGNLGTPVTAFVEGSGQLECVIAEVSSFQLETTELFQPSIAALLNVSPDHLDRHPGMEEYVAAKARIFSRMDKDNCAVFNADDPLTVQTVTGVKASLFPFSRLSVLEEGVCLLHDWITLRTKGSEKKVIERGSVALPGIHNLENALAAVATASRMGVPPEAMARTLATFGGLEHRMELVGYFRGVAIYNDSKGTNVGATLRSLEGLGDHVVLILGGKDKGAPYEPLVEPIRRKVSHLILLGEAAKRMEGTFRGAARILRVEGVEEAVKEAMKCVRPGGEILFSPACSSFDMFSGYEERGQAFKNAVRKYLEMTQ